MHIQHVEIGNFRKFKAVRIDFSEQKTIFVGANNNGKTSAMVALRRFLVGPPEFSINDRQPIDGDPFDGLICIDEISAQRGFGHEHDIKMPRENESALDQRALNGWIFCARLTGKPRKTSRLI